MLCNVFFSTPGPGICAISKHLWEQNTCVISDPCLHLHRTQLSGSALSCVCVTVPPLISRELECVECGHDSLITGLSGDLLCREEWICCSSALQATSQVYVQYIHVRPGARSLSQTVAHCGSLDKGCHHTPTLHHFFSFFTLNQLMFIQRGFESCLAYPSMIFFFF